MNTLAQIGIDPTPFTSWGVLGLLGLAFLACVGLVWRLVVKGTEAHATQNKIVMDFVSAHRTEFSKTSEDNRKEFARLLEQIGESVRTSNKELTIAFNRQSTMLDRVLLQRSVLSEIRELHAQGKSIDTDTIERAIEKVLMRHTNDLDRTRA